MKLWDKGFTTDSFIESFTVGNDRELDVFLAPYDVLGSIAHAKMLQTIGLLTTDELKQLTEGLVQIYNLTQKAEFVIEEGVEDVHSQVELMLTKMYGDTGKKIHSGRSRNDQVLVDIKLYLRNEIKLIVTQTTELFEVLMAQSETYKDVLMPGYTHLQIAMPSSFGLWFGAYAESLSDDFQLLLAAYKIINQNPLGSAAGYGSSFPLNRQMTTDLLGFDGLSYNVIYAQMGRGKSERSLAFAMSSIATTISRMAYDACLFMSQNFGFITLPDNLTTGSSIMPHKKNPDIFELLRARCNRLIALPNEISLIINNLPSGYFRDMQIVKEVIIPAIIDMKECIVAASFVIKQVKVNREILKDPKYNYLFSVEEVNKLVLDGLPFREAYKQVAKSIETGTYQPDTNVYHTHEGSIGNLCNDMISAKIQAIEAEFDFEMVDKAISELICI